MKKRRWILITLLVLALLILGLELMLRRNTALNSLGEWLYKHGRYKEAGKIFDGYAEEEEGAANLAKSRYKQGDYESAADAAEQA
ncbi:MAG: hypothetical protein PHT61_08185, partial [Candidatus Cloacimonetes bacterium]|nr:hypothetical protein [Candidatus Cloacimonadota bacterium]